MKRTLLAACLALLSAMPACETPPAVLPPSSARVLPATIWAGDTVLVRFDAPTYELPAVRLAGALLDVITVDDSTMAVVLPDTAGSLLLEVRGASVVPGDFLVEVFGFRRFIDVPPALDLSIVALPFPRWPATTGFVATTDDAVYRIDLTATTPTWSAVSSPALQNCHLGPGPSDDRNAFVTASMGTLGCNTVRAWRIQGGALVAIDSIQLFGDMVSARLAPNRWLTGTRHWVNATTSVGTVQLRYEETRGYVLSPRGDLALAMYVASDSTAILNTATALMRYRVPGLWAVPAAAFSSTGDTLFIIGDSLAGGRRLYMLDAATGTQHRSITLDVDRRRITDAALTVNGDQLLVLVERTDSVGPIISRYELDVYDAATLTLIRAASSAINVTNRLARLAVVGQDVYVFSPGVNGPNRLLQFRLPP